MRVGQIEKYQSWAKSKNIAHKSVITSARLDRQLKRKVVKELALMREMSVAEFNLYQKYYEINEILPTLDAKEIKEVKSLLYSAKSYDDVLAIEPEIIYVKESFGVPTTNIYGETSIKNISYDNRLVRHWQILRTFVSSIKNEGSLGRAIRFLVRDKHTQKYIGILCLSSSLATVKCLNDTIGWNLKDEFKIGSRMGHMANIQTCIGVGSSSSQFLFGKLLALLALSDEVTKVWKEVYGDTCVEIHTTAIDGSKSLTQYDNLLPYFKNRLGLTAGSTSYKLKNDLYWKVVDWMYKRYPFQFFRYNIDVNEQSPSPYIRDKKNRLLVEAYRKLGIKNSEFTSLHRRAVYHSYLYSNAKQFLLGQIKESELTPAFNNSVSALTERWKYDEFGQSTEPPDYLKLKYANKPDRLRTVMRVRSGVVGYVNHLQANNIKLNTQINDWFEDCGTKSYDVIKKKYLKD